MKIENLSVDLLIPYGKNAKKHPEKQVDQIANSIKRFGFNQPLVVDDKNVVVVGHGRLLAAKKAGLKEVPAVRISNLTKDEIKAYRLADNKLNESDWDMDLVIEELKGLDQAMVDLTGFDSGFGLSGLSDDFTLSDSEKSPFQQMTFTLADYQAEQIKKAIAEVKQTNEFKNFDAFENENNNGNALYLIILQWVEQKK